MEESIVSYLKKKLAFLSLALILFILMASAASAVAATKIGSGMDPEIDEWNATVVYTRAGGEAVCVYDLLTQQTVKIPTVLSSNAAVEDDKLVWLQGGKVPQLVIYDRSTKEKIYLKADAGSNPAISGNIVTWSASGVVYTYNIINKVSTKIANGYNPDIDDINAHKLVYESVDSTGEHDIVIYDLVSKTSQIVPYEGDLTGPKVDGIKVVSLDYHGYIVEYNMDKGTTRIVSVDNYPGHSDDGDIYSYAVSGFNTAYGRPYDNGMGFAGVYSSDEYSDVVKNIFLNKTGDTTGATVDVARGVYVWGFVSSAFDSKKANGGIYMCSSPVPETGRVNVYTDEPTARFDIYIGDVFYCSGFGESWSSELPVGDNYMIVFSNKQNPYAKQKFQLMFGENKDIRQQTV